MVGCEPPTDDGRISGHRERYELRTRRTGRTGEDRPDGRPGAPERLGHSLHFGARSPEAAAAFGLEADDDGTILRYDNAHERTKGHERHTAHEVERIEFPGMSELHAREREVNDLRPDGGR